MIIWHANAENTITVLTSAALLQYFLVRLRESFMLNERLVAHRGYQKKYPENTLLGMREAIKAGALYLETDIQFSSDNQPLLYHDILLKRVSGEEGLVHSYSEAQLLKKSAYEPDRLGDVFKSETIASLKDFVGLLRLNSNVKAFIEIKEQPIAILGRKAVLDRITKVLAPVAGQTVLISFDYETISEAHRRGWPQKGVVLKAWKDLSNPWVVKSNPEFIFSDHKLIPQNELPDFPNSKLVAYEVGTAELARSLLNRGVDMLETFDIGGLLNTLSHRAL